MIQPWRQLSAMLLMLGADLLGDGFQGLQMRRSIAIADRMIGDEINAALQQGTE